MKSKVALVLALAAVLAVPAVYAKEKEPASAPPGQAKKDEGQQPPGQEKKEEASANAASANAAAVPETQPATPATPAQPAKAAAARPAKPARPANSARPATPSRPAKPARPARPANAAKPVSPSKAAGPAVASQVGKITICHATHSATNPYVEITISVNGLNGHGHHDDIVPAPAGGCPRPQPVTSVTRESSSETATTGTTTAAGGANAVEAASAPASVAVTPLATDAQERVATSGVAGVQASSVGSEPLPAAKKSGGVLGAVTRSQLPFTGLPLLPFVFGGLLAIAVGTVLVRRRGSRTTV